MSDKRIVSLLPGATEMVCALGASAQLVGRSHECDYPPEVWRLPVCTSARINSTLPGSEIERQTKSLVTAKEPLYRLDAVEIQRLKPDIIITQAQCEVCAVSLAEVEAMVARWPGNRPQIVALSPMRLSDIWEDMRRVITALELGDPGREVLRSLKNRVVNIIEKTCIQKHRPRVLCIEWIEPLMAAGNWVPELVELAGGTDVLGHAGKHSAWTDWNSIGKAEAEIVIVMPCGFDLKRTRDELNATADKPRWMQLKAVKNRRIYVTDGNSYFNRPGPRIVESLEILAEILWPGRFDLGHKNKAWEVFRFS
jgi:iron complex transport system substrate-binding protein